MEGWEVTRIPLWRWLDFFNPKSLGLPDQEVTITEYLSAGSQSGISRLGSLGILLNPATTVENRLPDPPQRHHRVGASYYRQL